MPETAISPGIERAWHIAAWEALRGRFSYIEPVHLLIGACKVDLQPEGDAVAGLLASAGTDAVTLRRRLREQAGTGDCEDAQRGKISRSAAAKEVFARMAAMSARPDLTHLVRALAEDPAFGLTLPVATDRAATPLLDQFGRDLTAQARAGKLGPCIGRRDEMLQMVRALSRATKNNPLLIGDAGVGKTAIVEGLAWRIAQGKSLAGQRIVQVAIADLVSGTKYRGEFEERLTGLLKEAAGDPQVILFLDEIHGIVGAGDSSGNLDGANILKPALARGEIRCIGATTTAEYRKYIEKDAALERRFQTIVVPEPSLDETVAILEAGYAERFAKRHGVAIEKAALRAAVELSARYLPDRRLPDKAVDLLDQTCAMVAVPVLSAMPGEKPSGPLGGTVTADAVAQVLSEWTGIPAGRMGEEDRSRIAGLDEALKERVIGQDAACDQVARVVQRARAGLKSPNRPVGVLLFVGPTGVGKTELAKATAEFLFDSSKSLIRLDMSEYMDKHTVSRLIGAPPGYIGHDEEGQLTGALRTTPHAVVLLDEAEKAHPDVWNLFLQLFDEGRLTDSKGRTVDATHALFLLTSNIGAKSKDPRAEVEKAFRPEFVNRLDDIVVFQSLSFASTERIVRLMLRDVERRLEAQGIGLRVSDRAVAWLALAGHDTVYGARALRRAVSEYIEDPLVDGILEGKIQTGHTVTVDESGNGLGFTSQ